MASVFHTLQREKTALKIEVQLRA